MNFLKFLPMFFKVIAVQFCIFNEIWIVQYLKHTRSVNVLFEPFFSIIYDY